jgi:DNA-binding LacI/PurR family transcriptional regulator
MPMAIRIKDVARLAGVSSATVSRALADKPHVRSEVRQRVLDAVRELGYEPNRVARSLRVQRSSIIGLIISDIQNSFFNTIVRAIEDVAHQQGYAVFLCNSDENPEKERFYLNLLKAERVAGVILTPTRETDSAAQMLMEASIPVVTIDRTLPHEGMDSVKTNNREASSALVRHLLHQGHRRIAALLPDLAITTGRERFEGYKAALASAGIAINPDFVCSGRPVVEDGYTLTQQLLQLKPRPTGLFCGTKLMTLGALRATIEAGLRIPQDLTLAAFDKLDWMPCLPPMSYAEQPTYQIGERAAQLLLDRFSEPDRKPQHLILNSDIHYEEAVMSFAQPP